LIAHPNGQTCALLAGQFLVCDTFTNNGTFTLPGTEQLDVAKQFINHDVLGLITWQGTLPAGLVNHETIPDRNAARIGQVTSNSDLNLTLHGCDGLGYQFQHAAELSDSWTNHGNRQSHHI